VAESHFSFLLGFQSSARCSSVTRQLPLPLSIWTLLRSLSISAFLQTVSAGYLLHHFLDFIE